jgi:hypothetical protein
LLAGEDDGGGRKDGRRRAGRWLGSERCEVEGRRFDGIDGGGFEFLRLSTGGTESARANDDFGLNDGGVRPERRWRWEATGDAGWIFLQGGERIIESGFSWAGEGDGHELGQAEEGFGIRRWLDGRGGRRRGREGEVFEGFDGRCGGFEDRGRCEFFGDSDFIRQGTALEEGWDEEGLDRGRCRRLRRRRRRRRRRS